MFPKKTVPVLEVPPLRTSQTLLSLCMWCEQILICSHCRCWHCIRHTHGNVFCV